MESTPKKRTRKPPVPKSLPVHPGGAVTGARQAAPVARRLAALQRIDGEIEALRAKLDELMAALSQRLHGRLEKAKARLQERTEEGASSPVTLLAAERLATLVTETKIRPAKGRVKDLVRLSEMLSTLNRGLRSGR